MFNRSSYILFVRDAMKKSKSSDFGGNILRLKAFAQRWSKLSPEEKQDYKHLLDREWQQYWRDVEEFKKVCMPCDFAVIAYACASRLFIMWHVSEMHFG